MTRARRRLVGAGALIAFVSVACSKTTTQAGGLELIIATDLDTPSVFDTVRLEISQETSPGIWKSLVGQDVLVPSEATLPTTYSIAAGASADQEALIIVEALRGDTKLVQRVVQTQIPKGRVAELPLVLAASCVGKLSCSEGESCQPDTGMCRSNVIDSTTLPPFDPGREFHFEAGVNSEVGASEGDVDADADAISDTDVRPDAALMPPSCTAAGKGSSQCGSSGESCCASPLVPGGTFYRSYDGVTPSYSSMDAPATLSDFRLDTYEITVARFRAFVQAGMGTQAQPPAAGAGANPHIPNSGWDPSWNGNLAADVVNVQCDPFATWDMVDDQRDDYPINCLTWFDAFAFCIWDGGRLPTEAEWNYAAAGGDQQRVYPWGSLAPGGDANLAIYGCYLNEAGTCFDGYVDHIAPVGSIPAGNGRWGHSDLAGNVQEWTLDWVQSPYATPCTDCANLTPSMARAVRGGNFWEDGSKLLASARGQMGPTAFIERNGARCARDR